MTKIVPIIIAILKKENKYLLTQRREIEYEEKKFEGYWQFPGGEMEFAEDPKQTIIREMREEAGIEIEVEYLVRHILTEVRNRWQGLFICYVCKMKNEKDSIVINDESTAYGWFTIDEIKKLPTLPLTTEMIRIASEPRF